MATKRIKIIWLLMGFICYVTVINAQSSITIEGTQLYSSFKFTNSQGATLNGDYSGKFTGAYGIGYRYVVGNGLMLRTGLGLRKAGATMVYDNMNYTWDLQYAEVKLGGGYMLKKEKVSPYLNVLGYCGYMLRGFQTINNESFDIKDAKSMNEMDFGVSISPGVQFTFSERFSSFVEFSYNLGLQNLEKDDSQESKNLAYGLTLGISISLDK